MDQNLEALNTLVDRIEPPVVEMGHHPSGNGALVAVRGGYALNHIAGRTRARRTHRMRDIGSFARYINHRIEFDGIRPESVEVLVSEGEVVALLDPPACDGDRIECAMLSHPAFAAWKKVLNQPMTQRDLYLFLRGNAAAVEAAEKGLDGSMIASEVQKLTGNVAKDIDMQLDSRGFYSVAAVGERTSLKGQIPARWSIRVPVIQGVLDAMSTEAAYSIEVMLAIDNTRDPWTFTLACPSLPIVEHQALIDAVDYLTRLLDTRASVYLGSARVEAVPVVVANA